MSKIPLGPEDLLRSKRVPLYCVVRKPELRVAAMLESLQCCLRRMFASSTQGELYRQAERDSRVVWYLDLLWELLLALQ